MDHIFLPDSAAETEAYFPQGGRRDTNLPERDRAAHSARLKSARANFQCNTGIFAIAHEGCLGGLQPGV